MSTKMLIVLLVALIAASLLAGFSWGLGEDSVLPLL